MKTLKYALLGEGIAEYEFLPVYLEKVAGEMGIKLQRNSQIKIAESSHPSKSKVLAKGGDFCKNSLFISKDDFFVIGVDLDAQDFPPELSRHSQKVSEVEKSLGEYWGTLKDRIIIFVPIQAIDYWILYQFHQISTNFRRATPNSLEATSKKDVKTMLGMKNQQNIRMVAKKVAQQADFNDLSSQSASFKHFHQQVLRFLAQQLK